MSSSSFVSPLAYACEVPVETRGCTSSQGVCACELAGSNTAAIKRNLSMQASKGTETAGCKGGSMWHTVAQHLSFCLGLSQLLPQ